MAGSGLKPKRLANLTARNTRNGSAQTLQRQVVEISGHRVGWSILQALATANLMAAFTPPLITVGVLKVSLTVAAYAQRA